ncbi:MAG: PhzF family phenazine biosynthesis protein [Lachnospiraceae bacterium]|nr:PhzF family phenazine biosynthesis protein [Lachnospiraceae bacterium]
MRQYIVDAFTDKIFAGNPAAVCVMDHWISDELMTKIALENNFSETAFIVKEGEKYHLRWFTLAGEINLCGHATLAFSFVIFNFFEKNNTEITFSTLSGDLVINRAGDLFEMEFPSFSLREIPVSEKMIDAIGARPQAAYLGEDLLCIFDSEETVRKISPNLEKVKELDGLILHITAEGKEFDCVSRTFAPKFNTPEDPVCGRGHCHIIPYWTKQLQKNELVAYQASRRGGILYCRMKNNKVVLAGKAALFSIGELFIDI